MIEQISLLTVDLIGHISCLLLCTALFRRTCAKRQLVLAFLGTLAAGYLITVVPVIREFPIKAILLVMVFTVFCHACYEGKILTQCLCAVFSYVIMLALDTAAIFLFCNWVGMPREQIFADPQLYMICALFSYIVIFVVSFAIWRFAQSWTKIEKISVSGFLAMLVFPLVSLGTITFLFQVTAKDHSVSHWAIVNALGLVAANAVLMGLLHHIEQEAEERKQNVALQHQFETQLEKTQVLLEAQTAQRKQTHDFKHHLSVLGGLLQEENLAAARQYLAEISETGQLDALAVHSNNPVVDAILNQKYAQACELGIQVDFAINDLAEFPLSNKETVVVLSNLLDNAIEACKTQKGTRLIRVKIQCSEEKTILELHPKSWTRKSTKGVQKSMGKELFSEELKLAVVQYVLEGHTRKEASEKFCVSCTPIEKWVNLYKLHGAKGLLSRNLVGRQKGFDGEFRLKVLQYKQEHHLSCTQTAMHFCLDVVTVCRWEKKFQKEGARGLMKKQATKGSEKRQKKQEQSELQQENKRLSEENYRLRMENDYLKKLNALIQKREKPE